MGEAFGLPKLYSLAPGSLADWPITAQRDRFGLLFPSERPFVSCRLCDSRDCPGRQKAYDPGAVEEEVHA